MPILVGTAAVMVAGAAIVWCRFRCKQKQLRREAESDPFDDLAAGLMKPAAVDSAGSNLG